MNYPEAEPLGYQAEESFMKNIHFQASDAESGDSLTERYENT